MEQVDTCTFWHWSFLAQNLALFHGLCGLLNKAGPKDPRDMHIYIYIYMYLHVYIHIQYVS